MSKTVWKPGTMLYPQPPAMVSCGTWENPNIITIAWTGIVCTDPAMTYISVRPERYSYDIIKEQKEFVINLTTNRLIYQADLCGVKSGREIKKFDIKGITPERASVVNVPLIKEAPINLECVVEKIIPLGTHDMFLSRIVAVNADDALFDSKGVFHLEKSGLVAASHGKYYELGRQVGSFGFSVRKKK